MKKSAASGRAGRTARARLLRPKASWRELAQPAEAGAALRDISSRSKREPGIRVLLSGPSAWAAARVIAGSLGAGLYRIPLSALLSKYIGETEKNLAAIFERASRSETVLFFDEADALFGQRTTVRDAHDRYANQEVAYLLKRLEDYEGLAILATNLEIPAGHASVSRFHFVVDL